MSLLPLVQPLPVVFDPVVEDPDAAELDINDGAPDRNGFVVLADPPPDLAPPTPSMVYADSHATEGGIAAADPKYPNRTISFVVRVYGADEEEVEANLGLLFTKLGKVQREGGVLGWTTNVGTICYFDLTNESSGTVTFDVRYLKDFRADVSLQLTARPFWRSDEVDLEGDLGTGWVEYAVDNPSGDVPALGRLLVTESEGFDQTAVLVGVQSRHYDPSPTAALIHEAETMTPLGTSTVTAGAAGASSTDVIRNSDLVPTWQAIMSSELDSSGAALTHKGSFRVWARVFHPTGRNPGEVSVRLEWAEGDYRHPTTNDRVDYPADILDGVFTWADLGLVHISPQADQWEFRVLAKSTVVGDELDVDVILLFPTTEGYIELSGGAQFEAPTAFVGRDEFNQTVSGGSDPLDGVAAALGGAWDTVAGDAVDFVIEDTGHTAQRSEVSDADTITGRYAVSGAAALGAQVAQIDVKASVWAGTLFDSQRLGVLVRYQDTNNWMMATLGSSFGTGRFLEVRQRVGGTVTTLDALTGITVVNPSPNVWYTVRLMVDDGGRWYAWLGDSRFPLGGYRLYGQHDELSATGSLDEGKPGFYDVRTGSTAVTRNYNNFAAWEPTVDAAVYASQELELRHDMARRQNASGSSWGDVRGRRGRFLRVPPGGLEARRSRLLVKSFRNDPRTMPDPALDDVAVNLYVTPRGLVIPS